MPKTRSQRVLSGRGALARVEARPLPKRSLHASGAASRRSPAYRHRVQTLPNGLEVVTVEMPHLHSAQVALLARVGSRYETPKTNGLSHLLEHMFFRGCAGFPDSTALNAAMEDLGGQLNGYTTRDHSGFPVIVHPRQVRRATEILGAMFCSPLYCDLDIERQVVLEEMQEGLDERGREIDTDTLAHRAHFAGHGLAQPIEGLRRNIHRFKVADLEEHRRQYYGARNLCLVFAGNVIQDNCVQFAQSSFGELFSGQRRKPGSLPSGPRPSLRFRYVEDAQTSLKLSFRTVPESHPDHPALELLQKVLDGGLSARLQAELVERRGLAYDVSAELIAYEDTGVLDIEVASSHEKLKALVETLEQTLLNLCIKPIEANELARVRARATLALELGLDRPDEMVQWFGVDHLFGRGFGLERRIADLNGVDETAIHQVARKYLVPQRMTAVAVGGARQNDVSMLRRKMQSFLRK